MPIDWFTLVAQGINFLVLVWLLKRLFYDRIIHAMNQREAGIAGRLEEAAQARRAAEMEAAKYRAGTQELEQQREEMLARAADEAEARRQALLKDAREQADKAQQQWLKTLQRERENLLQDFRERVGQGVFALAGQGLKELADADLEAQILKVFVRRIQDLDPDGREAIMAKIRDSSGRVKVSTSFPLSRQARDVLTGTLHEYLGEDIRVRFGTDANLICGIELRARSHCLSWNLASWLEGLEARVFAALDEGTRDHAADH
ncbi:MAG: hypothetical protein GXY53_11585 [Desulfobulbus sp.]|nr:hypothetical protein [Desulfobulbus sp.]